MMMMMMRRRRRRRTRTRTRTWTRTRTRMRMLIVGDNCGSHKTLAVRRVFAETDAAGCVTKKEMAANITDCKQVCDMAFNGAVKQKIVAQRVAHLYDELQAYKLKHDEDKTAASSPRPSRRTRPCRW